jgi:hypothetical protein
MDENSFKKTALKNAHFAVDVEYEMRYDENRAEPFFASNPQTAEYHADPIAFAKKYCRQSILEKYPVDVANVIIKYYKQNSALHRVNVFYIRKEIKALKSYTRDPKTDKNLKTFARKKLSHMKQTFLNLAHKIENKQ